MPIVLYWLEDTGAAAHRLFGDDELRDVLQHAQELRKAGMRHVSISSEPAASVGQPGVDGVERGRLPSGEPYTFNKRHRGGPP
jgi:hypothetical protein